MNRSRTSRLYRQIIAATLLVGGAFQLVAPALAQQAPLTAAGEGISNTATATYADPNDPDTPLSATSNTVTITVAEVAGINVTPAGVTDNNGGSVSTGDILNYDYLVTNVGNDPTRFYLPNKASSIVGGTLDSAIKVVAVNGKTLTQAVDLPANGFTDDATFVNAVKAAGVSDFTGSIAPGNNVQIRVPVKVTTSSNGSPITVVMGNTTAVQGSTQNQPYNAAADGSDIRTADNNDGVPNETAGIPANGEREASATQSAQLAAAITTRALATVLATRSAYDPGAGDSLQDDKITYRLDLRVESSSPNPSYTPGTLTGTPINLDGSTQPRILVSDAIPQGTVFDPTFTPKAPSGWEVVYSTTPVTGTNNALSSTTTWTTTQPAAGQITRIGFVYNGTLAPGSTTVGSATGFQFRVVSSKLLEDGGNIANIAQVFGQTQGDSSNTITYDESGDQKPNNFNDDNTSTDSLGAGGFNPSDAAYNGTATPATQGTDPNNNNTGTGRNGEANTLAITKAGSIFNGPINAAQATGAGGSNQNDFTNKSANNMPTQNRDDNNGANIDTFNPNPIAFKNTVFNPSSGSLDNLVIKPIAPSRADFVFDDTAANQTDTNNGFGTDSSIPNGTVVTITPDVDGATGATYTWNGTEWQLSGSPLVLTSLGASSSYNYRVIVDLPAGTSQLQAFPVPIVAFVDSNNNRTFDRGQSAPDAVPIFNLTVNRAYTGYVQVVKKSQILKGTSSINVTAANGTMDSDTKTPVPGNIIKYQIEYKNISTEPPSGSSGSVILNASKLVITEDGVSSGTNSNNWYGFTTHVKGTSISPSTSVQFFDSNASLGATDPANGTSVTKYVNTIGTLTPGDSGNLSFQRQVK